MALSWCPAEDTSARLDVPTSPPPSQPRNIFATEANAVPLCFHRLPDNPLATREGERIRNLIWRLDCLQQTTIAQHTAPRVLKPNAEAIPTLLVPEHSGRSQHLVGMHSPAPFLLHLAGVLQLLTHALNQRQRVSSTTHCIMWRLNAWPLVSLALWTACRAKLYSARLRIQLVSRLFLRLSQISLTEALVPSVWPRRLGHCLLQLTLFLPQFLGALMQYFGCMRRGSLLSPCVMSMRCSCILTLELHWSSAMFGCPVLWTAMPLIASYTLMDQQKTPKQPGPLVLYGKTSFKNVLFWKGFW